MARKLLLELILSIGLCSISADLFAADSLSYSGRLVQANGAPVAGPVTIRAELAYTNALSTILCTEDIPNVALTKGVFHVKLNLDCTASGLSLNQVLAQAPAGESVAIQIRDMTNSKSYSFQALHSIPYSNVSQQLVQMGATNNQVLKWNDTNKKWEPGSIAGAGTVTSVSASLPLSVTNGSTTPAITIAQANGTTNGYLSSADWTAFNNKQAALPAGGTLVHYYRGDSTWQVLDTAAVSENAVNLYFTNARALGVPLAGIVLTNSAIANGDTFIQAFGKVQAQINALGTAGGNYLVKNGADTLSGTVTLTNVITASVTGDIIVNSVPLTLTSAVNKVYVDTQRDTRVAKTGDTMSGTLTLDDDLEFKGAGNSNYVAVKAHATTGSYSFILPQTAGTAGYVLRTDGAGNLSWIDPGAVSAGSGTVDSTSIADGSIVNADVSATAAIAQSKIQNLTTDLAAKVSTTLANGNILVGSAGGVATAVAVSGDATLANTGALTLSNSGATAGTYRSVTVDAKGRVTAGTNPGAVASVVATPPLDVTGTADDPIISIPAATTAVGGYLTSADWNTFNGKQAALAASSDLLGDQLRIYNGANYVELRSPALGGNVVLTLPTTDGNANQLLQTDGSGNLTWTDPATLSIADGSIGYVKLNLADGDIPQAKVNGLTTALSSIVDWAAVGVQTIEPTRLNLGLSNRVVVTNGSASVAVSSVTATELGYLSGVTSNVQTQLNAKLSSYTETDPNVSAFAKAALPTCGAGEVLKSDGTVFSCVTDNAGAGAFSGTADRAVLTDGSGNLAASAVTNTELGYLSGVSGAIQTQLNAKQASLASTTDLLGDQLRVYNGANYVEIRSPGLGGNIVLTLPTTDGDANQVLQTDGSGNLTWVDQSSFSIADGSVTYAKLNLADGDIPQAKVNGLVTALAGKEPVITAGTTAQYLRGDKTLSTFATDVINSVLTGFTTGANSTITASDTVLSAFEKTQGQINAKLNSGTFVDWSVAGVQTLEPTRLNLTIADRAIATDASGTPVASAVTATELGYLTGVTSAIQTQLNAKQATLVATSDLLGDQLRIYNGANYVEIKSPTLGGNVVLTLPTSDGNVNQVLQTDGSGNLTWVDQPTFSIADSSVTYAKLNLADGDIPQAKVNGLVTALAGKEPTITAGTSAQYYRGDKTFVTLDTSVVPENGNLYFTDARAKAAAVVDAIVDGVLDVAPSQNAVYDSLATKINNTGGTLSVGTISGVPTPTNSDDVTNKNYVDTQISYSAGIGNLIPASAKLLMKTCPVGWTENGVTGGGPGTVTCDGSICKICQNGATAAQLPASTITLMETCPASWTSLGAGTGPGAAGRINQSYYACQSPASSSVIPQSARLLMPTCPSGWKDIGSSIGGGQLAATCDGSACRICETPGSQAASYIVGASTSSTGVGGSAVLSGAPGGSTSGTGGYAYVMGGTTVDGFGGSVVIAAAAGAVNGNGGDVSISSGAKAGTGADGKVTINGNGGYVGIGTASPGTVLDTSGGMVRVRGGANFGLYPTTGQGLEMGYDSTAALGFISAFNRDTAAYKSMLIDSSSLWLNAYSGGNVGVGNASPQALLHVGSENNKFAFFNFNNPATVPTSGMGLTVGANYTGAAGETNFWNSLEAATTAFDFKQKTGAATASTLMTMLSNGNVGIGTAAPVARLDVYGIGAGVSVATTGATDATTNMRVGRGAVGINLGMLNSGVGYIQNRQLNDNSVTYGLALQPTGGNVGIGTATLNLAGYTTNASVLTIAGTGDAYNGQGILELQNARATAAASDNVGNISFTSKNNSGTEKRAAIISSALTGAGGANGFGGTMSFSVKADNTAATSVAMTIKENGYVGIGNTSPSYILDVTGVARFTGNYTTSDVRYKKNITNLNNSLDNILKLRGVGYDFRTDQFPEKRFSEKRQIGLLAQEVEKVFPEVVNTDIQGYKSVSYQALIAPVVDAIKELYAKFLTHDKQILTQSRQIASVSASKADKEETNARIKKLELENAALKSYICNKDPAAPICKSN